MKSLNLISNALSIVSNLTAEQVETVAKQAPEALMILTDDGCGGREVDFALSYNKTVKYGRVDDNGIVFPGTDDEGHLLVTVLIPANVKAEDYVYETYAVALNQLAIVEEKVVEALKNDAKTKAEFVKTITKLDVKDAKNIKR